MWLIVSWFIIRHSVQTAKEMRNIWFQKIIAKSGVILYISKRLFLIPDICLCALAASALLGRNLVINHQKYSGPGASSARWLVRTSHVATRPPLFKKCKYMYEEVRRLPLLSREANGRKSLEKTCDGSRGRCFMRHRTYHRISLLKHLPRLIMIRPCLYNIILCV